MVSDNNPLVTVIVPNYNYERSLGLCLQAARDQTYRPLEILVVDDCSTDGSAALARSFGVQVLSTPRNSGVAAVRNLGAAAAAGDILMFVDSDVALHPDAVLRAVRLLQADPYLGAVTGNYDPEPLIDDGAVERYRNFHQYFWMQAAEGVVVDFVLTAIMAMPAAVFAEVGPFNPALRDTEGADYGRRIGRRHRILLTGAVRGRHDNDATMRIVLRKVFTRTRLHVPFFLYRERFGQVATTAQSGGALAAAVAAAGSVAPALLGPAGVAVPALALLVWVASDRRMYQAAWRYRGARFAALTVVLHYVVSLATAAGVAVGILQWAVSARFRGLYEPPPVNAYGQVTP